MKEGKSKPEYLRSSDLSQLTGVSTDTLRHYERKGVLSRPRRSANGYREYPSSAVERVRMIQRALAVGFTLDELAPILSVRDRGGAPCNEVRALAAAKLTAVNDRLDELVSMRDELQKLLREWDELLRKSSPPERAGLLDVLAARAPQRRNRASLYRITSKSHHIKAKEGKRGV